MGLQLKFEKVIVKDLTDRIKISESTIEQQAEQIALRVSTENYNGNVIASLINQTANEVKIQANKISMEGLVTANSNFKILLDGSIEAVNAKLSGSISATKMVAVSSTNYYGEIGLTGGLVGLGLFDVRYNSEAFFEVLETVGGRGFLIRDYQNRNRVEVTDGVTRLTSPSGNIRFTMTDDYVNITNNGVTLANWG